LPGAPAPTGSCAAEELAAGAGFDAETGCDVLFDSVLVHRAASRAQGKRMLRSPTHPFVFYTAGEVTRRLFPGHVPYAESVGLWARARDLGLMLPLLRRHWQPWLDGTISLDEALRRIVTDL